MTQQNEIKHYLEKLISKIIKKKSHAPNKDIQINIYLKQDILELDTEIDVDYMDENIDEFKFSDSEYFKDFNRNNFFKNKIYFELKFESIPDGWGDYYNPYLYFYDDSYSEYNIQQKINLTKTEEIVIQPASVDFFDSFSININLKSGKKEVEFTSFDEIKDYISKSNNYTNVFNEIMGLFDNGSKFFIEYTGVDETVLNKESLIESVKKDLKVIENSNLFESFLSKSFSTKTSNYFFFNSDNPSKILSTYVVEHEGYNFYWNSYNRNILSSIKSINLTHSYYDREWRLSNLELSSSINGNSSTILKKNDTSTFEDLVYSYIKDSLKYNPFKKRYTKFSLFLNRGLIETIIITENKSIFGLNQNGEVVFALKYGDSINTSSILKDKRILINNLNALVTELSNL